MVKREIKLPPKLWPLAFPTTIKKNPFSILPEGLANTTGTTNGAISQGSVRQPSTLGLPHHPPANQQQPRQQQHPTTVLNSPLPLGSAGGSSGPSSYSTTNGGNNNNSNGGFGNSNVNGLPAVGVEQQQHQQEMPRYNGTELVMLYDYKVSYVVTSPRRIMQYYNTMKQHTTHTIIIIQEVLPWITVLGIGHIHVRTLHKIL